MKYLVKSPIAATGLAMFSMFFGAGNLIFSLVVGKLACDKNLLGITGFLISAVGIPFLGLIAIILFDGDYKSFFSRIGKFPGFVLMMAILGLLGPLGVVPRCIILSHETLSAYAPSISLPLFSIIAAVLIFLCTVKEKEIINLLGRFLSPLLLACLAAIIIKGLFCAPSAPTCTLSNLNLFSYGFIEGYKTLDLCAALFFSASILAMVRKSAHTASHAHKQIAAHVFKASIIGATLLASVYIGMSFVTAGYSSLLASVPDQQLFITIARHILGDTFGIILCCAVIVACLTTAIALTAISATFAQEELLSNKISYTNALIITLLITVPVSMLKFSGIMELLIPFLRITYPAIIALVIVNTLYKLCSFQWVKLPFYATLLASLMWEFNHLLCGA
ncbi:branched-chain amino acid transport system II carrier protein [Candidatus Dependentiae bacterium]|nr:branched-chain amino acid transport system II carrier protein [Candidatus Dependentiae bacterium]MCC7415314.1 branched-chain amino acid transport system II carrier protein [Campylobacterota bacterium]